jgi:histidinol phosphate phosphatase hisN-like protein
MSELLAQARTTLVTAGITGPHQSHSRANAISKILDILAGDTDDTFGLTGLDRYSAQEVHGFVAELTGSSNDIANLDGYDEMDPDMTIAGILNAARRLLESARRGHLLLAATGHPTGLLEHHIRVVDAYRSAGGKILRAREDENLSGRKGRHAEVRYTGGVGCLADWGQLRHTHSSLAMELLLESEPWPDVVLADHGFAGAAIERGIPTIAVMDINDPALAVAWAEHKDVVIIPMDDNRLPRLYEPSWMLFERVLGGEDL